MRKFGAAALGLAIILSACAPEEEESVEDRFRRTEAAIENTAAALEAETDNAVSQSEATLQNDADAFENRLDAVDPAESNAVEANQSR